MRLILMGPQGSGKGTIGEMLATDFGVPLIGMGQLLRDLPKESPHYEESATYMEKGELVPDEIVAEILKARLREPDCSKGYILDGFPRDRNQLEIYFPDVDHVLVLTLSRESSIKRITGRRMCDADGKIYNIYTLPPEELEKCKGNLTQRADDTEDAVNRRLDIYYNETQEVIDHYRDNGLILEIDAEPLPQEIVNDIKAHLNI